MYLCKLKSKGDRSVTPYSPNRAMLMTSTDFDDLAENGAISSENRVAVTARHGHLAQMRDLVFRGAHEFVQSWYE